MLQDDRRDLEYKAELVEIQRDLTACGLDDDALHINMERSMVIDYDQEDE